MTWRLQSDGESMDCLWAAAKEKGGDGANGAVGGGGRGVEGGTALPEMSSNITFADRTADGDGKMDIDGEEMAEKEAASVAEEEGYHLRSL